jgi:hypothetical protein
MAFKEACMRLTWIALVFVALVVGTVNTSFAQAAQAAQPPAAAQQAPAPDKPALTFQSDAGLIIIYIKPDKTADFEALMTKLKDGLAKMDAPEAKQQAASLKLFKVGQVQTVAVYVLFADPVVKNIEYWFLPILYKAYPADGQALLKQWQDAKAATPAPTIFDLTLVTKFQ